MWWTTTVFHERKCLVTYNASRRALLESMAFGLLQNKVFCYKGLSILLQRLTVALEMDQGPRTPAISFLAQDP